MNGFYSAIHLGLKNANSTDPSGRFAEINPRTPLKVVTHSMAIHPDGKVLAVADNHGVLILIDLQTFQVITRGWIKRCGCDYGPEDANRADLAKDWISTISFSLDGKWIIFGARCGLYVFAWKDVLGNPVMGAMTAKYSLEAETVKHTLPGGGLIEQSMVYGVAFDDARQRVLYAGLEGKIRYLDLADRRHGDLQICHPRLWRFTDLSFSSNRCFLACVASG